MIPVTPENSKNESREYFLTDEEFESKAQILTDLAIRSLNEARQAREEKEAKDKKPQRSE